MDKVKQFVVTKMNQIEHLQENIKHLQDALDTSQLASDFNEAQFSQMKETLDIRQNDYDMQESELRELKVIVHGVRHASK